MKSFRHVTSRGDGMVLCVGETFGQRSINFTVGRAYGSREHKQLFRFFVALDPETVWPSRVRLHRGRGSFYGLTVRVRRFIMLSHWGYR